MMRAHQPGSQPLDIPEAIPNPAVPQPAPAPSPAPREPVKVPVPQDDGRDSAPCGLAVPYRVQHIAASPPTEFSACHDECSR